MNPQFVEVKLELGHRAVLRTKVTEENFTHDWTIFVRGPDGANIHHFVEKVIFYLHETFPKPKRVIKEAPYQVSESGYAGFNMTIEVCFKNKEEPKRVSFEYDLYLQSEGPPIVNSRLEKLTFQNPTEEFRKKLMKGGAIALSGAASQVAADESSGPNHHVRTETEPYQASGTHHQSQSQSGQRPTSSSKQPSSSFNNSSSNSAQKGSNQVPKKTPKSSSGSSSSNSSKQSQQANKETSRPPEPPPQSHPFTDIFGTPIKTKPSPDQIAKSKESIKDKSSKINKTAVLSEDNKSSAATTSKSRKESKSSHKSSKHSKELKKKDATDVKAPPPLPPPPPVKAPKSPPPSQPEKRPTHETEPAVEPIKKRKRTTSVSSTASRDSVSKPVTEPKKAELKQSTVHLSKEKVEKPRKEQRKPKEKRQKEKSSPDMPTKNVSISVATNSSSSVKPEKTGKSNNSVPESLKKEPKETATETIDRVSSNSSSSKENNSSSVTLKNVSKTEAKKRKAKESPQVKKDTPPPPPPPPPLPPQDKPEKEDDEPGSSSNDSVSSTSPQANTEKENGPLATMIAEMEEQNIISPMSSDQEEDDDDEDDESNNKQRRARSERSSSKENRNTSDTPNQKVFHKTANTNGNSRQDSPSTPPHSMNTSSEPDEVTEETKKPMDHAYLNELKDLQGKIMSLKDRQHLQMIVDLIEETGLYQVSGASFDFDLCSLDRSTVQKLQKFLAVK